MQPSPLLLPDDPLPSGKVQVPRRVQVIEFVLTKAAAAKAMKDDHGGLTVQMFSEISGAALESFQMLPLLPGGSLKL